MFKSKLFNTLSAFLVVAQVGIAQKVQKLLPASEKMANKVHVVTDIGAMKHTGGKGTYFVNAEIKNLATLNIGGKPRVKIGGSMGDISLETMPKGKMGTDTFDTKFAVGPTLEIPILKAGTVKLVDGNSIVKVPRVTVDALGKVVKTVGQGPGTTTAAQFGVPVRFNTTLPRKPKAPTGGPNPPRKPKLIYGEITPTYTGQSYLEKGYVDGKVFDKTNKRSGFGLRGELGVQVLDNTNIYMQVGTRNANPVLTRVAKGPFASVGTRITL